MALETSAESPAPVRQIANLVSQYVDRLGAVWVEGQIAQVSRRPGIQTVFMTLRDAVADISVPLTVQRSTVDALATPLVEGASVVVLGKPSYYANRGSFSLQVREIRMVGLGELLARLERRRQLLAAEGLFARELKRPLPFLPRCVGLVTAPSSAAERDVLENARRRWPHVRFEVAHATMQGQRAAGEVIEALDRLERHPDVDVIVVARGGGSVEDLLPFSDEGLVRAVFKLRTPVVSAIGHEPDQPLLDLVADVRASTPTDAAKLVVPDVAEEQRTVLVARERMRRHLEGWVAREQHGLDALRSRPVLADPHTLLDVRAAELDDLLARARRTLAHRLDRATDDIAHHRARARALSPLATLQRGYAVLQDPDGHVVTSVADVAANTPVTVRVADGRVHATTTSTELLKEKP
jgi:exodeoxyribonuclease VII large subunit